MFIYSIISIVIIYWIKKTSGQGMKLQVLFAVVRQRSEATCYIGSRAC